MSDATPNGTCLQCGDSRETAREPGRVCGIEGGYEYRELEHEWPRHRWADWTDKELTRQGVKPEAFERHRRERITLLQYIPCDDHVRGHVFPEAPDEWFEKDRCMACGYRNEAPHE